MKFDGDSFHLFGGICLPCEGTFCTVFRVVPRDLTAEIREVPINSRWPCLSSSSRMGQKTDVSNFAQAKSCTVAEASRTYQHIQLRG
jgi:hypothetical protein